ncbi:MAG: hypothetical protein CL678_00485 [Bdellovibrionaceae bacterium]|nr:hypothetical protein [Pseudobdellovibrionaceae bacterium]
MCYDFARHRALGAKCQRGRALDMQFRRRSPHVFVIAQRVQMGALGVGERAPGLVSLRQVGPLIPLSDAKRYDGGSLGVGQLSICLVHGERPSFEGCPRVIEFFASVGVA